jgi:hypothetical protein
MSHRALGEQFLYHRTTPDNAANLLREGRFHPHPDTPGNVYASDKANPPKGSFTYDYGEGVVEIKVPPGAAHLEDDFGNERHYRIDAHRLRPEHFTRAWSDVTT